MYLSPSHSWRSQIYKIVNLYFSYDTTSGLILDSYSVQYPHAMLFLIFFGISLQICIICILLGVSSLNCSKFTKMCPFLIRPARMPCFSKRCLGRKNRIFFIILFLDLLRPSNLDYQFIRS